MQQGEIRSRLVEVNPWWKARAAGSDPLAWVDDDQVLRDRKRHDVGFRSPILHDIAEGPVTDSLVILRGPRRVGKSVALKDVAARLCTRPDVDPRQIVYLPADGMTAANLGRAVTHAVELTRSVDADGRRSRIWLLDEVTSVDGWTTRLKYLRDNTPFGEDTVVCTGSSWSDASSAERDLFAGRAGSSSTHRARLLLPMSFREVLAATRSDMPLPPVVPPWDVQSDATRLALTDMELFIDDFDLAWHSYLTSGGFPRAVAEHARTGDVSDSFVSDLTAWLHRDVDAEAADDSVPLLLHELEQRLTAPLNRTNVSEKLGYGSRQTFDLRLRRLVRCFAAVWCHQVDDHGVRVSGAQSKLYLVDPLLAQLGPRVRAGLTPPDLSRLTEAALGVALAAAIEQRQPGRWLTADSIGYVRTSGGEIDFAPVPLPTSAGSAATTTPVESKWVSAGWRPGALAVESRYGRGIVATRNVLDLSHRAWAIPAPIVALLLR